MVVRMFHIFQFLTFWGFLTCGLAFEADVEVGQPQQNETGRARQDKALSVFQVVRFPNTVCAGSGSYNGTCYTSSECTNKGGTSAGSCASGFGVCCVFTLSCGGSASDNCTYLVQSSTTSLTSPCTYTICPCNTNICRIRFDFTAFIIADPINTPTVATAAGLTTTAGALGDCATDTFSISAPSSQGTPTICGTNTGQHMIVDANSLCHKANFQIGSSTATTRSWTIKVTQYACGSEYLAGPPQCMQYFTGTTGVISSYNFPTTSSSVSASATHLSNQCYQICIRRETGMCYICYTPAIATIAAGTIATQNSFGLSVSGAGVAAVTGLTDTLCSTDYIVIPGGMSKTAASTAAGAVINPTAGRVCGRFLGPTSGATDNTMSVCTRLTPFRLTFKSDANEVGTAADAIANEMVGGPSGTVGFSLRFTQSSC